MDTPSKLRGSPRANESRRGERGTAPAGTTRLAVVDDVFSLRGDELDRLLDALARLALPAAETVADEIAAQRLAGGVIRLLPTQAELTAVEAALAALADEGRPVGPELLGLASACASEDPA